MRPCEACGGWGVVGPAGFRFSCAECDGAGWIVPDAGRVVVCPWCHRHGTRERLEHRHDCPAPTQEAPDER